MCKSCRSASATFYFSSLIHHLQYITCQGPLSFSVQEFWGNGGPDNSRYEDTCAELPAWSRGLCWGQGQEERKWGTEPNTKHRKGWAGEPNAFVKRLSHMLWKKKSRIISVSSPSCKQNVSVLILSHLYYVIVQSQGDTAHALLKAVTWPSNMSTISHSDSHESLVVDKHIASSRLELSSQRCHSNTQRLLCPADPCPPPCPLPTPPGAPVAPYPGPLGGPCSSPGLARQAVWVWGPPAVPGAWPGWNQPHCIRPKTTGVLTDHTWPLLINLAAVPFVSLVCVHVNLISIVSLLHPTFSFSCFFVLLIPKVQFS